MRTMYLWMSFLPRKTLDQAGKYGECCHHAAPAANPAANPAAVPAAVPVPAVPLPRTLKTVEDDLTKVRQESKDLQGKLEKQVEEARKAADKLETAEKEVEKLMAALRAAQIELSQREIEFDNEKIKVDNLEIQIHTNKMNQTALENEKTQKENDLLTSSLANSVRRTADRKALLDKYPKKQ